ERRLPDATGCTRGSRRGPRRPRAERSGDQPVPGASLLPTARLRPARSRRGGAGGACVVLGQIQEPGGLRDLPGKDAGDRRGEQEGGSPRRSEPRRAQGLLQRPGEREARYPDGRAGVPALHGHRRGEHDGQRAVRGDRPHRSGAGPGGNECPGRADAAAQGDLRPCQRRCGCAAQDARRGLRGRPAAGARRARRAIRAGDDGRGEHRRPPHVAHGGGARAPGPGSLRRDAGPEDPGAGRLCGPEQPRPDSRAAPVRRPARGEPRAVAGGRDGSGDHRGRDAGLRLRAHPPPVPDRAGRGPVPEAHRHPLRGPQDGVLRLLPPGAEGQALQLHRRDARLPLPLRVRGPGGCRLGEHRQPLGHRRTASSRIHGTRTRTRL
ncbi:MAG: hypothetical protein AVDCRST_MAG68-4303, partial [uncultured Gemmatimonadetes bacterium]